MCMNIQYKHQCCTENYPPEPPPAGLRTGYLNQQNYGCGNCGSNTRFLCSLCSACSQCCPCDGDDRQKYYPVPPTQPKFNYSQNHNCGDGYHTHTTTIGNECLPDISLPPVEPLAPPPPPLEPLQNPNQNCPYELITYYPTCCYERPEISHPCPWPWPKRLFLPDCPLVPGYTGHVPGYRTHGAARTFGDATRDTALLISQWSTCCSCLPYRIFEQ